MKGTKKRIARVLSFLLVACLIFTIVKSQIPIEIYETAYIANEKEALSGANIDHTNSSGTISNWKYRIDSRAARIGRLINNKEQQKWLFQDTENEYKNLYCIQTGNSQAAVYNIYDLYSFSDDTAKINQYFGNRDTYNHFMWILENMYLVNQSQDAKSYMENNLINKIGGDIEDTRRKYEGMVEELQGLYSRAGVSGDGSTNYFTIYHYNGKTRVATNSKYAIEGRENFIQVVQNYLLLSYTLQRSNSYGTRTIDDNGNITLNLRTYSDNGTAMKEVIGNDKLSKQFAHKLLSYLTYGYNSSTYNINKYKNFENDAYVNTTINKENAKFNNNSRAIGPFTVNNKYGFGINLTNVSYGAKQFSSDEYRIVDAFGNTINLSDATDGRDFYIELTTDFSRNGKETINVSWNIDFGEVPDAKIFIPTTGTTTQVMLDIERTHRTKSGNWNEVIENYQADIALKKYIYSVNGNNVADRLGSIDLTNLKNNGTPHNATYNMNKTPINVNIGDTVTYAIRLFNEGEVDGTASKITDQLPNYLTFVKAYNSNGEVLEVEQYNYGRDVIITTKLDNMKAFSMDDSEESFKEKSQIIYVDCKVVANINNQKVYTNIAEISEYKFEYGADIDSNATNWSIGTTDRNSDDWINYTNNQNDWLDGEKHSFVGQEDDDDFDKIKVNNIDLALTKRIEGKLNGDGSETYLVPEGTAIDKTRVEISGYEAVKNGSANDLTYNMNKKPAIVSRGDKLVTVLTVYNEGSIDGVVKQITDYLPAGLNYNDEETRKLNDSSIEFEYNKDSKYLFIKINGDTGITLKNINEYDNDVDKFEIKIVTDVDSSANGRLYNSAQITDYGYVSNDGTYYQAYGPGVDKDSMGATEGSVVRNKHKTGYSDAEITERDLTQINKNDLQHEDDDDVDAVEVLYNPDFDLSLRKYVYKVQKDFKWSDGKNYTITYPERVPTLNSNSVEALEKEGTAEYYHDKIKVNVEIGDIVTYRIRVYNEGIGEAYDGRATQVTDYLPEGVEFVELENGYENEWKATVDGKIITLDYIGDKILPSNSIEKIANIQNSEDGSKYYQEIGIVCKVTADATNSDFNGKALTNRAAITGDEAFDNGVVINNVTDKDSETNNLTEPKLDTWYEDTITNEDTPEEYYPGEEDDDDFDTIYVKNYTLSIEKTDGENRLPGVEFKVYKYRYIAHPEQIFEAVELTDVEEQIKNNGSAQYITNAPTNSLERDYYVIKEVKANDDYINPFEGKYIEIYMYNNNGDMIAGTLNGSQAAKGFAIYEDNGDDNYFNDKVIDYNSKDKDSAYNYGIFDTASGLFNLTLVNRKTISEGYYTINLKKLGTDGKQLGGVEFDAKAKFNGAEEFKSLRDEGEYIVTDAKYTVDVMPKAIPSGVIDINPEKVNVPDEIILKEVGILKEAVNSDGEAVKGKYYLGLEGKEIKITINKNQKIEGNTKINYVESIELSVEGGETKKVSDTESEYSLEDGSKVVVKYIEDSKTIEIVVTNPEDDTEEPEIHKGVKTVENQDSGYNKNEIQTWVINSSVPAGISKFTKYVITDTIDYEKTVVAEKRIAFINEDKPEENVTVKYKGTDTKLEAEKDYKVDFDKENKVLTISFINGSFDGGKSLNENTTLEITYNTMFTLDENGNIIGLNQAIPNTAHLTYGVNDGKEITKKSETPEVHTGGVGVYKYDTETNKALEGAHFKIARSEEDAKNGKFVKVRDENGKETDSDLEVITNAEGYAKFEGLEFGEDAEGKSAETKHKETGAKVYEYDWSKAETKYYIVETEAPENYNKLDDVFAVTIKASNYESLNLTEYHKVGNTPITTKTGEFELDINKYVKGTEQKETLSGAGFKVSIKADGEALKDGEGNKLDGTHEYFVDSEGHLKISGLNISKEGITYTIEIEESTVPDGYVGLDKKIEFTAKSISSGDKLVLDKATETISNDVKATINEESIWIDVENRAEPTIHKGVKTVENQDSGYDKNEVQTWVINTTIPSDIADYTKYIVTDTIDYEKTNVAEKRITFINEDKPEENVTVKYKGTDIELKNGKDYFVHFDKESKVLVVTFINDDFDGGKSLNENTTLEITYNTMFTLDENGNIIGLNQAIPNTAHLTYGVNDGKEITKKSETPEVHTGGVGVYKYDTETNKALEGAHFKIARSEEDAKNGKFVKVRDENGKETDSDLEVITNAEGYAKFEGLEFGEDAEGKSAETKHKETGAKVYEYDWSKAETKYYIVETEAPENYNKLDEVYEVTVKASNYESLNLTEYHKVGNSPIIVEGNYDVKIIKYGKSEDSKEPLSGVNFVASRIVNNKEKEDLGTITTDGAGSAQVGSLVTIETDTIDVSDEYTIKEDSVSESSAYYVGLDKEIKLIIHKQSNAKENEDETIITNSIESIEMIIEGESVTEIEAGRKYVAKIIKDNQELEIVAELQGNTITLTIENPHKNGTFSLDLNKYIKGTNLEKTLSGAGFKVSIKADGEALVDGDGNKLDGTHEYFVNSQGHLTISGLNISKAGISYAVEIEESTVPDGYIGIDGKFGFTTKSIVYGNKFGLEKSNQEISNDVNVTVNEGNILVSVENRPEPIIHKGVKTVENQDSGYNKNEIQTWVINSSVPAGISKFTKYVITDTIDYEKTVVAEKRIAFINEDKPEENVAVKIKETGEAVSKDNYKVTFDKEKKVLTITFIDGEFKKGQTLPENSTLEITYNTKFTLDENGNIIGLNQAIQNQAHLTYSGEDSEEKTKESETPEVHTGGVGVFKYDDKTGKALEGAHFKLAKSEEDARNGKFIKVIDENGLETDEDVELITGTDGRAQVQGLEFGEDAKNKVDATKHKVTGATIYEYDWSEAETTYYLIETEAPEDYNKLESAVAVVVKADNYNNLDLTKYFEVGNKAKVYDLSLRKFIVQVEDRKITNREPQITLTDEFKNGTDTTAKYEHTKSPVVVQQGNIVTYTIRVYNEGPEDCYASIIKDDIPDGVEFVDYTEGDGSVNAIYKWKLLDADGNEVTDKSKAKYVTTTYLAKENGEGNLIKAYNSEKDSLDYKDVKVQFKVIEPNTSERILTNYAQISKMTNSNGKVVTDRDSTPDEWIEDEDDQDIENIKLLYFDLSLRKWVTKAIVLEDGKQVVTETGHKAEDEPEAIVKVDLKRSKIKTIVIKFEYKIRVTNEGKIGGWAEEVTDHIPDGLTFEQTDNQIWTKVDNNTIVTDALKDVYLEPGESAEVPVVLKWENSASNLGIKNNIAEISKDRNEYGVTDIDSTPGNFKLEEDDTDDAPVMLSVKTGNIVTHCVALGVCVLAILVFGVKAVKKSFKGY